MPISLNSPIFEPEDIPTGEFHTVTNDNQTILFCVRCKHKLDFDTFYIITDNGIFCIECGIFAYVNCKWAFQIKYYPY
jgi:hypothetical protein